MKRAKLLDRRTALRGLGVAIGLPLLESMLPGGIAHAEEKPSATGMSSSGRPPVRLAFICLPNGM